jgi:hypothetical protein
MIQRRYLFTLKPFPRPSKPKAASDGVTKKPKPIELKPGRKIQNG